MANIYTASKRIHPPGVGGDAGLVARLPTLQTAHIEVQYVASSKSVLRSMRREKRPDCHLIPLGFFDGIMWITFVRGAIYLILCRTRFLDSRSNTLWRNPFFGHLVLRRLHNKIALWPFPWGPYVAGMRCIIY